jgi:hypothetical protein
MQETGSMALCWITGAELGVPENSSTSSPQFAMPFAMAGDADNNCQMAGDGV